VQSTSYSRSWTGFRLTTGFAWLSLVVDEIKEQVGPQGGYNFVTVPLEDEKIMAPANFLRIGDTLVIQKGFPASLKLFESLAAKDNLTSTKRTCQLESPPNR